MKSPDMLEYVLAVNLPDTQYRLLERNLSEDPSVKICLFTADGGGLKEIWKAMRRYEKKTLLISGEQKILDIAAERDIPCIGWQKEETGQFLRADMIAEGFEEVDGSFLQRVYERHYGIPWTILETERCIVRELALSDMDALFEMYEEKGMTDYMEGLYGYEEETAYQKAYIENMYRFYGYGMWLIFEKKTGRLIGRAGVENSGSMEGKLELGYAVRTSYQRQGYACEVCRAIVDYARDELCAPELHCMIQSKNTASEKLAQKLGFRKAGSQMVRGIPMEHYMKVLNIDF